MSGICEGRVVIVTGAGRGLGRAHALELARQGARVVVNDLGCELDGTGGGSGPAGEVVDEIRGAGGEAVANGGDVASFEDAAAMVRSAIDAFGGLDRSEEHTSELQSLMRISYAVFCLKKKKTQK